MHVRIPFESILNSAHVHFERSKLINTSVNSMRLQMPPVTYCVIFPLLQEAHSYADENGLLFMETSAKTAVNVYEVFLAVGNGVYRVLYTVKGQPYNEALEYLQ